jgi:hypothetical protein
MSSQTCAGACTSHNSVYGMTVYKKVAVREKVVMVL